MPITFIQTLKQHTKDTVQRKENQPKDAKTLVTSDKTVANSVS